MASQFNGKLVTYIIIHVSMKKAHCKTLKPELQWEHNLDYFFHYDCDRYQFNDDDSHLRLPDHHDDTAYLPHVDENFGAATCLVSLQDFDGSNESRTVPASPLVSTESIPYDFEVWSFDETSVQTPSTTEESWELMADVESIKSFDTIGPTPYRDALLFGPPAKQTPPTKDVEVHPASVQESRIYDTVDDHETEFEMEGVKRARGGRSNLMFKGNQRTQKK